VETLGHGSSLIIDGLGASTNLSKQESSKDFLKTLAKQLEPKATLEFSLVSDSGGHSVLLTLPESHLTIHVFDALGFVSLRVFSALDLAPDYFSSELKKFFTVSRLRNHLSNHSKTLSSDKLRREKALLGDRRYAEIRLDTNLLF